MQKDQLYNHNFSQVLVLSIFSIASVAFLQPCFADAGSTVLRGSASQSDIYSDKKPSLERNDIDESKDPFGSGGEETFDAPDSMFQGQSAIPDSPKPYNLNANQQGQPMQGQPMVPQRAMPPMQAQQPIVPNNQQAVAQDPESVGQMKLAWDMWHKRVAEAIYVKYDRLVKMGFSKSRPLAARASYTVTRDGRIINVKLIQKSNNFLYNTMIFGVLKSMNGSPILAYPQGSRRMVVEKTGRFLWNVNNVNGFRYTTGDRETITQPR